VLVLVEWINYYKFDIPDSAFFYGQQALTLARQIKFPKGEAQALFFIALTNRTLGNNSKALELQLKGLQIADRNNLTVEKQQAMTSLGVNYSNLQNYSKALFYLYQALKIADPNDPKRSGPTYLTLKAIGDTYLSMNKLDSAEHYSQLAFDHVKQYNINFARRLSLLTIGRIHNIKGELQLALDFFRQSLNYDTAGFETNFEIAKLYQQINQPDSAIYYARKSLNRAQKVKSYSSIITASKLLAELYQSKDAQKAIEYNKITIAAQDTLNNFGKTSAFKSITEFDEKERLYEIETAKTAYKNQIRQDVLLAGLGVFLLIAFILFRNNSRKQRTNEFLEKQKQEIDLQRAKAEQRLSELKST
jgi:tetratricopeptide (TPR) repeat protein